MTTNGVALIRRFPSHLVLVIQNGTRIHLAARISFCGSAPHFRTGNEKRIAFLVLALALTAQIAWMAYNHFRRGAAWLSMSYPMEFAPPFLLLLITGGRVRWIAALMRLPIAISFLSAVGDRLGLLGGPGTPGVAWGNFANFVAYTAQVNSFMPVAIAPVLAVAATICESTFVIALLFGWRIRSFALGSAGLLFRPKQAQGSQRSQLRLSLNVLS